MRVARRPWYALVEFAFMARLWNWLLRPLRPLKRLPPNLVTVCGALLVPPMTIAFLRQTYLCGAACFAAGLLTDGLDGALARHQAGEQSAGHPGHPADRSQWLRLGPTALGQTLDPAVDKLRYFSALLPLGWHAIGPWVMAVAGALAVGLTFFRMIVRARWGLESGANAFGKFKVIAEAAVIASLIGGNIGLLTGPIPLILFATATGLAAISLSLQGLSAYRLLRDIAAELKLAGFMRNGPSIKNHLRQRKP